MNLSPILISALVPTYNEQDNVEECLKTLTWVDELVVVDSYSSDNTVKIAKKYADKILQHEYLNSAAQKNWAFPQLKNDWVLIVDADERVTQELKEEIIQVLVKPELPEGFFIKRENYFLGKKMLGCGWSASHDKNIRFFRKSKGSYQEKWVHAGVILEGKAGTLDHPMKHYSYKSIAQYFSKLNRYSTWAAQDLLERGKRVQPLEIFIRPVFTFIKMYIFQAGFRDGWHGFLLSSLSAIATLAKYAKAWELRFPDLKSE